MPSCPGCGYTGVHGDENFTMYSVAQRCSWVRAYREKSQWHEISPHQYEISKAYADAHWREFDRTIKEKVRSLEI